MVIFFFFYELWISPFFDFHSTYFISISSCVISKDFFRCSPLIHIWNGVFQRTTISFLDTRLLNGRTPLKFSCGTITYTTDKSDYLRFSSDTLYSIMFHYSIHPKQMTFIIVRGTIKGINDKLWSMSNIVWSAS